MIYDQRNSHISNQMQALAGAMFVWLLDKNALRELR